MAGGAHTRSLRSRLVRAGAALLFALALVTARLLVGGFAELSRGDRALADRQPDRAIAHYRRAASVYVPLGPHVARALSALEHIAREAEREGDSARALSAERAIHAALVSARSFYTPHAERLALADERIAVLVAATASAPAPSHDPGLFFTVLALAGWLAWTSAAFALFVTGLDAGGRLTKRARWSGLTLVAGIALFALGLALA